MDFENKNTLLEILERLTKYKEMYDKGIITEEPTTVTQSSVEHYLGTWYGNKYTKRKTVVTVLPDTAERYFSTPLFEE